MKKFSRILAILVAGIMTASFALADEIPAGSTTAASTPSQTTPVAKIKKAKATKSVKSGKKIAVQDLYECPMCRITANKPGKCPMCGMDMVKVEKKNNKKTGDEKKM